ncbi:MAG: phenylalanine--tRNA ligase subunit beta [Desulfobacterales bacterium]|nr:phenylalanine--tRNA ligase subunit beta [Desulfobacterales bacterium]
MKISLSWLKEYVDINENVYNIADALTMTGLEVEGVSQRYDYLNTVLVGRIKGIIPHPNSNDLKICSVDTGNSIKTIVCGAPNVQVGMIVPAALSGTNLPNGAVIEESNIRGITSEGMICSEFELCLGDNSSGIMNLNENLSIGQTLSEALHLDDYVLEIGVTPNRGDCLSIIGIAREVAAIYGLNLKYPEIKSIQSSEDITKYTSVTLLSKEFCPRYAASLIFDIKVKPSPFWLKDRLLSVGIRPISNIVDVTNFVMLELGQPLHAFDFDNLAENKIVVKTASKGEKFTTLDGKEHLLDDDTLMICDGNKGVAIGGVMGGLNSEIQDSTKRVLLESAYFDPISIRKTSKRVGIKTEASFRFERGVDPEGTLYALKRASQLIVEVGNGALVNGFIDEKAELPKKMSIKLTHVEVNRLLGTNLYIEQVEKHLKSIECTVNKIAESGIEVVPPSFRSDISRKEDLIEEVARLSGYNNIPVTYPHIPLDRRKETPILILKDKIKDILNGFGFTEAINYSFISEKAFNNLKLHENDKRLNLVRILNPLSDEQGVMRSSLIPGLLLNIFKNLSYKAKNLKMFEIGKIFIEKEKDILPDEKEMIVGIWTGSRYNDFWGSKEISSDFYDIKGVVEGMLTALDIKNFSFTAISGNDFLYLRKGFGAKICSNGNIIGCVGEVSQKIVNEFEIKQPVYAFEFDLKLVYPLISEVKSAFPIPKFPSISRDITLIIDKKIESNRILEFIKELNEELIELSVIFDVYDGSPIPDGKKSLSVRVIYRSKFETLKDNLVNDIHKRIAEAIVSEFNAELP